MFVLHFTVLRPTCFTFPLWCDWPNGPASSSSFTEVNREFKHGYENNNEYDRSYWCYFRSRTGKFDLSFHVVRACQIYANHGSGQCEHLAFSSLECYNPQNLLNYYDMAGNDVNAEKNLLTGRRI